MGDNHNLTATNQFTIRTQNNKNFLLYFYSANNVLFNKLQGTNY